MIIDSRKFTKKVEDFVCEKCGTSVNGDGFTNHCSKCLWSKHVDINPGDRSATCGGMMEPVGLEIKSGEKVIIHKCENCNHIKRNRISEKDSPEEIIAISQKTFELN